MKRILAICSLALLAPAAWAQEPAPSASPEPAASASPQPATSALDTINNDLALNFIHHTNMTEIQQAQLALTKTQNQQQRDYAQTLITDHQANEQQLQQLASQKNVTIQSYQPATYEAAENTVLQALSQAEFETVFPQVSEAGHNMTLQDLQVLNDQTQDTDIKAFIGQTIPVIQQHQQQAAGLASQPAAQPSAQPSVQPSASPIP